MKNKKILLLLINLLGGSAVIGSYILGALAHPVQISALWGGVPESIRSMISINMLIAAAGYLFIFYVLMVKVESTSTIGRYPLWILNIIYLFILVPSSLWISLTFAVIEQYSPLRWLLVIAVLVLTGLASIALLISMIKIRPKPLKWFHRLSILGGVFLVLQTAILDAVLWTIFFY